MAVPEQPERKTSTYKSSKGTLTHLVFVLIVLLIRVIGDPPKDKYGRPMKFERTGRFSFKWVEYPSPVGEPSNPLLDQVRGSRDAINSQAVRQSFDQALNRMKNTGEAANDQTPQRGLDRKNNRERIDYADAPKSSLWLTPPPIEDYDKSKSDQRPLWTKIQTQGNGDQAVPEAK